MDVPQQLWLFLHTLQPYLQWSHHDTQLKMLQSGWAPRVTEVTRTKERHGKQVSEENKWGNAKLELEGGGKRGIKPERDSKEEDGVEETLWVRGQGQENKNISDSWLWWRLLAVRCEYWVGFLGTSAAAVGYYLKTFEQTPLSSLHWKMTPLQWAMSDINAIQRS